MRKKDLVTIGIVVVVFVIGGALLYRYISPASSGSGITYEAPHPVNPNFDEKQLIALNDRIDYTPSIKPQSSLESHIASIASGFSNQLSKRD